MKQWIVWLLSLCVLVGSLMTASCASSKLAAAQRYIDELEQTLEINGIDADDTVGGCDAYAEYYDL